MSSAGDATSTLLAPRVRNPFVGPRSFAYGEPIYGRAREINEIRDLLIAERLVFVYSPSGAGKSSLIEAGLRPELETRNFRVLPTIRVGRDPTPAVAGSVRNRYVSSTILSLERAEGTRQLGPGELERIDLGDYLDRLIGRKDDGPDPCLIFDQFEEVFTLAPADHRARATFFEELGHALRDRGRWALFAMREDSIALLDPYLPVVHRRPVTRYRLDLLGVDAARAAASRTAAEAGAPFSDEAVDRLIDDLRTVRVQWAGDVVRELGPAVEPVQLQVVCRQLWGRLDLSASSIGVSDVEALGDVDNALADFYDNAVSTAAEHTGVTEGSIRSWVGDELITEQGLRSQVLRGPGERGDEVIRELEDAHLVRAEQHRGARWVELAHDRLVGPVQASNDTWRQANLESLRVQAQSWSDRGRPEQLLLSGRRLTATEAWASSHPDDLWVVDREFLRASRQAQRRSRTVRLAVVAAIALLAALCVVAFALATVSRSAERTAEEQTAARLLAAQASVTLRRGSPLSLVLAAESARATGEPSPDAVAALVDARTAFGGRAWRPRGEPLRGHRSTVDSLAFSPDGSRLASASLDGTVRLWDPSSGEAAAQPLVGHTEAVESVAFSPNGALLASASDDTTIRLWAADSGQLVHELRGHREGVIGTKFSPDGALLASASDDDTVRLWDPVRGVQIGALLGHQDDVNHVAFNPTGSMLASASADGTVRLWDPGTRAPLMILAGHDDTVWAVAFSPDGTRLASASADRTVRLWDASTGSLLDVLSTDLRSDMRTLAFSPDGRLLATGGSDRAVRFWDPATGDAVGQPLFGHTNFVDAVAYAPSGRLVASAGADATIRLWEPAQSLPLDRRLTGHAESVFSTAFSPDGAMLASGSADESIRLWDAQSGRSIGEPLVGHSGRVIHVIFSPDGRSLVSASADGTVRFWDPSSGQEVGPPLVTDELCADDGQEMPCPVQSVSFHPDGKFLAAGIDNGTIEIWDVRSRKLVGRLEGHTAEVSDLVFSPDGERLASASYDQTLRIWDPGRGIPVGEPLTGHTRVVGALAFSPDGHWLASASHDATIRLWNPATGEAGIVLSGHTAPVVGVAFSADGHLLASASQDGTVRIWDPAVGETLGEPLSGHQGYVWQVQFGPDGMLASAGQDQTVRLWDVLSPERACELGDTVTKADVAAVLGDDYVPRACKLA